MLTCREKTVDRGFFLKRIKEAVDRRERLLPGLEAVRLVHSEGDFLPGLVVDRYADAISIQTLTLGMELWKDTICDIIEELLGPHNRGEERHSHKKAGET